MPQHIPRRREQRITQAGMTLLEMRDSIDRYKNDADKNLIRSEVGSENYPPDLETLVTGVDITVGGTSQIGVSAAALAAASGTAKGGSLSSPTSTTELPSKVRYLRKIPVDPMTGKAEWGLRAIQDDPDSHSWGAHNVFDVYSLSTDTGMDGTNYGDW